MHTIVTYAVIAATAYLGTMMDNFIAFTAQLALAPAHQRPRLAVATTVAIATLIIVSGLVGNFLHAFPLRLVGLLALAPWVLAVRQWRRRDANTSTSAHGVVMTYLSTLGLGGDNVAIWSPLFCAGGLGHDTIYLIVFIVGQAIFLGLAVFIARHRLVRTWVATWGPWGTIILYGLLGFVILLLCHDL